MYGVKEIDKSDLRALFTQKHYAATPVVLLDLFNCKVVSSHLHKDCQVVTVSVEDNDSFAQHVEVMKVAMETWFDEEYKPDLFGSLVRISIPHSMSCTRYDRKMNGMTIDADPINVGDELGFQVCLRKFGKHTIYEGEHQVMTYDCMCVFE